MKISDGLGNQLFQYAIGRMVSIKHSVPLKLDLSWFKATDYRPFQLRKFSILFQEATANEIQSVKKKCCFREPHFEYATQVRKLPQDVYLDGYWQSEKYFSEIASLIRKEFTLTTRPGFANQAMARKIQSCQAVSLHIRRGDYANNPVIRSFHGLCGENYYKRAIETIMAEVEKPHFFIFSDDWDWICQKYNYLKPAATIVSVNTPAYGYEDLRLMSLCRHHIIANSSFSWWGAWLADTPEQIVIAPKQWFTKKSIHKTIDLCPTDWRRIDA
ncbi:MAG TPA: alpha-1,2-fucosyltransferase [Bacillota bacterium]|nr:alpha-1,2-fucosyltransferase [Bacillota bacterium]